MSARQERAHLTLSAEIARFIRNPKWCWQDATDDVKRGYLVLLAAFGIASGVIAVCYSDWLSGRVACAAQFHIDERIYYYGLFGFVAVVVSSLLWLGVYAVQIAKTGLRSTAPPILQGNRVWMWWVLMLSGFIVAVVIMHHLLRMC